MHKFATIAAIIISALASTAAPSNAQSIELGPNGIEINPDGSRQIYRERREDRGEISERRAARIAREEGMDVVENVSRRRGVYIIRGVDRRDNDMRVVIDRRSGEVLEVR